MVSRPKDSPLSMQHRKHISQQYCAPKLWSNLGTRFYLMCLAFFFIFLALPTVASAEIAKVKGLRIADRQSTTRVVFDLSSAASHNIFVLKNPDRVVLDIQNCNANGKLVSSQVAGTLLKGMRYAQKSQDRLRVVFDLNKRVAPQSFLLPPAENKHYRLVIDLASANQARPTKPVIEVKKTPLNFRDVIIAIDAGHGGKDPGAIGRKGTREKDIVLSVSKRLKTLIDKERGMKAVLIRDRDTFIPLRGRIRKANNKNADVFISIHADAAVNRRAVGSSVYVLSEHGATSEAARILAKRENEVDKIGGISLEDKDAVLKSVLVDLSQTATIDASIDLAQDILSELSKIGNVSRRQVEQAGFAVLKSPDIPSVLVETAFISNPHEEQRLRSSKHQQALAQAILKGVRRYLTDHAPSDALLANLGRTSTHTIRRGETLSGIANRYQVSVIDLRRVNELTSDKIQVGQVITIPASTGT